MSIDLEPVLYTHSFESTPLERSLRSSNEQQAQARITDVNVNQSEEPVTETKKEETDEQVNKQRQNYIQAYKLKEPQFDLVKEFFSKKQRGNNLSNKLLRLLMTECLKGRKEVKASQADIDRALKSVDGNSDDRITFDEFLNLLLLFFSSKENLEMRVEQAIKIKRNASEEKINAGEAAEFTSFLNNFYGTHENKERPVEINYEKNLELNEFVKKVCPGLKSSAFVKWQGREKSDEN